MPTRVPGGRLPRRGLARGIRLPRVYRQHLNAQAPWLCTSSALPCFSRISILLFSSGIRNTVAIKVPEGVPELFEISKICL